MDVMEELESMESLLEQEDAAKTQVRKGAVVTGKIVGQTENGWLVDVGYKCEGFLPAKEWSHRVIVGNTETPAIDDEVTVQVLSIREGEEAQLLLSRWRCELDRRWNELEEKVANDETVKVKGIRKVKGGLMVECFGLEGFIPVSHLVAEGRGGNPGKFIDTEFDAKLLEKDRRKHRLVFSRRSLLENEAKESREKFYATVTEGTELEGEVSSLTAFGVFINLGPLDGLVHMTELSWKRNTRMKDAFKKGDKVKVKVIGIDREADRISLSIKQTVADPWETVAERWQPGMIVKAVVTNVTDFGAFVELEPGIEGLIHISDVSWSRIKHPREVLHKGQEVEVKVLEVDPAKRRIGLGYKQLNDPWASCMERYQKGQDIKVTVVRLTDFGAFVEVEDGVEGLIHISQLSQKRVEHPKDVLAEKQEVVARIIEINPERRRMRLSLSALEEPLPKEEQAEQPEQSEQPEHRQQQPQQRREKQPRERGERRPRPEKQREDYVPDGDASFTIGDYLKEQGQNF